MSKDSQQAILHVLQQDSAILGSLLGKLKELHTLYNLLAKYLDTKLAKHCAVASFEDNTLTVITDSALWATPFRFQIPILIEKLKQHPETARVTKIICKIRPAAHKPQVPAAVTERTAARLSPQTAATIVAAANTIKDDRLQTVMLNIAKHTTR